MPSVNPELLIWAREFADLDECQASQRLNVTRPRLADMESGRVEPSSSILESMATVYRQPLIAFYMQAPPAECDYGIDYRTRDAEDGAKTIGAHLKILIRETRSRQEMLRDALDDEEEAELLPFVASQSTSDGVEKTVTLLRKLIDIDVTQYYAKSGPTCAFDLLRDRIHDAGVYVLLDDEADRDKSTATFGGFRGFFIADPVTPFVVINSRVAEPTLSSSLLHQFAHLVLGNTGISGIDARNDVEKFCVDVASNFLLPTTELRALELRSETESTATAAQIERFAASRNLSRDMVAFRAWQTGKISSKSFRSVNQRFRSEWNQSANNHCTVLAEQQDERTLYERHRYRVGEKLINTTHILLLNRCLTTIKAAKVLNAKAGDLQDLFDSK